MTTPSATTTSQRRASACATTGSSTEPATRATTVSRPARLRRRDRPVEHVVGELTVPSGGHDPDGHSRRVDLGDPRLAESRHRPYAPILPLISGRCAGSSGTWSSSPPSRWPIRSRLVRR